MHLDGDVCESQPRRQPRAIVVGRRRIARHDDDALRRDACAGGEDEADAAGEMVFADVEGQRLVVVDLDELEALGVLRRARGVVGDLDDDEARASLISR